jgi:hypothetical protein
METRTARGVARLVVYFAVKMRRTYFFPVQRLAMHNSSNAESLTKRGLRLHLIVAEPCTTDEQPYVNLPVPSGTEN